MSVWSIFSKKSFTKHPEVAESELSEECCGETVVAQGNDRILLFATKTCPNCKMAAMFLDKAGIAYEKVYAEESPELAEEYGITQAPTLIVIRDGAAEKIANVSNIRKFTETVAAKK